MLDRLKTAWRLGQLKPEELNVLAEKHGIELDLPLGDGKAEFLGEGTHAEFEDQKRADKGLRGIFGL